jgi:hypothetical protein
MNEIHRGAGTKSVHRVRRQRFRMFGHRKMIERPGYHAGHYGSLMETELWCDKEEDGLARY